MLRIGMVQKMQCKQRAKCVLFVWYGLFVLFCGACLRYGWFAKRCAPRDCLPFVSAIRANDEYFNPEGLNHDSGVYTAESH